jgi:hypothetical protein
LGPSLASRARLEARERAPGGAGRLLGEIDRIAYCEGSGKFPLGVNVVPALSLVSLPELPLRFVLVLDYFDYGSLRFVGKTVTD